MWYDVLIWFLDQENIGLDPQIMILHQVISEILEISDFETAFWKMAEISSESQFFFLVTSLIWFLSSQGNCFSRLVNIMADDNVASSLKTLPSGQNDRHFADYNSECFLLCEH